MFSVLFSHGIAHRDLRPATIGFNNNNNDKSQVYILE